MYLHLATLKSRTMKNALRKMLEGFGRLTQEEIDTIVDSANVQTFKKGTVLLREGEVSKECYSVLSGCVREYYMVDGEEKTTAFFTEGQAVNSFTSFTNNTASKHYLVCAEDCILTIGNEQLEEEMCQRIPRLESIIRQEVEKASGRAQDDFAFFITSSPEERYLKLLDTRPHILQRMPQHQIASYLGIKPESLSRIRKRIFSKKMSN